jgi:hypothetical protein
MAINEGMNAIFDNTQDSKETGNKAVGSTSNYTWSSTYDHKKINKLIINQDVLLRTPITQVRRHIDDLK